MWGVCNREVGVVRDPHQGGEEGVGRIGRVVTFDGKGQGKCQEEVQEGPPRSSLGDSAPWLQEGVEACSCADCVLARADVVGGEVVKAEAQGFADRFEKESGGVRQGSPDVKGGDEEVHWVHEDGLLSGPARDGSPEAGGYVGVQVGGNAAQEDGPDNPDLRDCTHYGAPDVRVGPVPLFVEGAENVCPVWWQERLPPENVPQAMGKDMEEVGWEVVVHLRREAVVVQAFALPETVDGIPDFVDGEGPFPNCLLSAWFKT